jgi:radical SAM protein with 4Fe4S-binding SPASM domain
VAGIRRLRARGLPLKLKTMALRANAHEIEAMRAFAEELGLPFHHDALLNARVDCGADRHHEQQLSAEAALALERRDEAAFARLAAHAREVVGPRAAAPDAPLYTCGAGVTGFTVDPYGALQLCQVSRRDGYDLREGSFAEGWNVHFPKLRARRWQSQALCRTCELVGLCGNCPGAAELEHGDPEAVVASFCEIAHARAFATLGGVAGHREDAACCLGGRAPEASEVPLIRELRVARRPGP